MKKQIALILAALMCCGQALAITRTGVVYREGSAETVVETLYESRLGFSFWYDAERYEVDESMSEDGSSLIVYPIGSEEAIYLEIMLPGSVGGDPVRYLEMNSEPGMEYEFCTGENGLEVTWFQRQADFDGEYLETYYAVTGANGALAAASVYPGWADEGAGAYFRRLICSISLDVGGLRACWAEDAPDGLPAVSEFIADDGQPQTAVVFWSDGAVTDFKLLALSFSGVNEDGEVFFTHETLYSVETFTADTPLLVRLTFAGDMPNYGVSYTDGAGRAHTLALDISGENGSLILWEFR